MWNAPLLSRCNARAWSSARAWLVLQWVMARWYRYSRRRMCDNYDNITWLLIRNNNTITTHTHHILKHLRKSFFQRIKKYFGAKAICGTDREICDLPATIIYCYHFTFWRQSMSLRQSRKVLITFTKNAIITNCMVALGESVCLNETDDTAP